MAVGICDGLFKFSGIRIQQYNSLTKGTIPFHREAGASRRWKKIIEVASGGVGDGDLAQGCAVRRELDKGGRVKTKYVECSLGRRLRRRRTGEEGSEQYPVSCDQYTMHKMIIAGERL